MTKKLEMMFTDGDYDERPLDQSIYALGINEAKKEEVRKRCKDYIIDFWGKEDFEEDRGVSIDEMLEDAHLGTAYIRRVPTDPDAYDYDVYGPTMLQLLQDGDEDDKKVWTLEFLDDHWRANQIQKEENL